MNNIFNNLIINCSTVGIYYGSPIGFEYDNNIIQDCGSGCVNSSSSETNCFHNCITDDATIPGGINCHQNTELIFEDKVNEDYRLHISDIVAYRNNAGIDKSELYNYDINGDIIDNSWCIGPFHKTPEITFSVGDDVSTDLKTGSPTYSITNSILTFSVPQTNEFLCAGCIINRVGPDPYVLLKRKIDNSNWEVVNSDGTIVANNSGPVTINTINFFTNDVNNLVYNVAHSDHITQYLDSDNLTSMDIKIKIACANGSSPDGFYIRDFTCDRYRNIEIFVPDMSDDDYIESNSNRKHNGVWDLLDHVPDKDNYPNQTVGGNVNYTPYVVYGGEFDESNCINIAVDWCVINGLQISGGQYGIYVINSNNPVIKNNIIKDCIVDAVHFVDKCLDGIDYYESIITKNLIYNCGENGIRLNYGRFISYDITADFITFSINNIENFDIDIHELFNKYTVELKQSSYDTIIWSPGKLTINFQDGNTMSDVLLSDKIYGEPWGVITAGSGVLSELETTKMDEADSYVTNTSGDFRKNQIKIYHNTIIKCNHGIYIETVDDSNTNVIALLKNNLITQCIKECYYTSFVNPSSVLINHCASDDSSLDNFVGMNNINDINIQFVNISNHDYRLTLNDTIDMYGYHTLSDECYQVEYDNVFTEYESINNLVFGSNTWKSRNKEINFSIGANTENLDENPDDRKLTITNGILTFTGDGISDNIGIGDKITYENGGTKYCYLAERGNNYNWHVLDVDGNEISDTLESEVTSIKRVFNSLAFAISDSGIIVEFPYISDKDINSKELNLYGWCYNDNDTVDTGDIIINGWLTHPLYKFYIQSPDNIKTQCSTIQSHSGVWGGYRISSSDAGGSPKCLTIDNNFIVIKRLSLERYDNTGDVINAVGNGIILENNIIRNGDRGILLNGSDVDNLNIAFGNIVYDSESVGIDLIYTKSINNTIVNCGIGVRLNDVACKAINNISHEDDGVCYSGKLDGVESCLSNDDTAGTSNNNMSNVTIEFNDKNLKDFHIKRKDWYAINNGVNFGSLCSLIVKDGYLYEQPFYYNIDGELISDNTWCRGADTIEDIETINLYFSANNDTSNFITLDHGTNGYVSIDQSIATFSTSQIDDRIGVGDKLIYTDDDGEHICYLYEKISDLQWIVKDLFGLEVTNSSNANLNSITRAFVSSWSNLFLASSNESVQQLLGTSDNPFIYLTKAMYCINIALYKYDIINSSIVISGFITDINHYIKLFTPVDLRKHCNASQSHRGSIKYENPARIHSEDSNGISIECNYTIIDGIICSAIGYDAISLIGVTGCVIINNILFNSNNGITSDESCIQNIIINNTIYNIVFDGIKSGVNDIIFNNTVDSCGSKCFNNYPRDLLINNIGQRAGDVCFNYGYTENCIASDLSLVNFNNNINELEVLFIGRYGESDPNEEDYHLTQDNYLVKCAGKRLDGNSYYKFNIDGSYNSRSTWWDIGSLEFQSKRIVYSIGISTEDLQTKYLGNNTHYTITVKNEISFIEFSNPQINIHLGIGDRVFDDHGTFENGCFLIEKITESKWIVYDIFGNSLSESSGIIEKINRVFPTIRDACNNETGFPSNEFLNSLSLYDLNVNVTLACYNDEGDFFSYPGAYIYDIITEAHNNLRIIVPNNIITQCNKTQRHDGVYGYGNKGFKTELTIIDGSSDSVIQAFGIKYLEIEGLQIKGLHQLSHGIHITQCKPFYIGYNIIQGIYGNGILCQDSDKKNIIVNNLIYDCNDDGIGIEFLNTGNGLDIDINNNTIVNCRRGVYLNKINDPYITGLSVRLKNNLCQDSEYKDYVAEYENHFGHFSLSKCISGDETASNFAGTMNIRNRFINFIDRDGKNFNLNNLLDGIAVNNALDLSGDNVFPFTDDITGTIRDVGEYDIGAFEVVLIFGYGELIVGPTIISGIGIIGEGFPVIDLYLRGLDEFDEPDYIPYIDPKYQFINIEGSDPVYDLNAFIDRLESIYSLVIHAQGGEKFPGMFSFNVRPENTIVVKTYEPELIPHGPASFVYINNIIDDESSHSLLTFKNLKIYSNDSGDTYSLFSPFCPVTGIRFENCIIQVNNDCISQAPHSTIQSINSILIFRNDSQENIFCLVKDGPVIPVDVENLIANSIILTGCTDFDVTFVINKLS